MAERAGGDLRPLVHAAAAGDQGSWNEIVERFHRLLWAICRAYRLSSADSADVCQVTWLRLLENLGRIQDPERLPGWLSTTCRRECQAVLRRARRSEPIGADDYLDRLAGNTNGADARAILSDRDRQLWDAFARLNERCQRVLRVLVVDAEDGPPSYAAAAATLGMPAGALGPTRGRCLSRLRRMLEEAAAR